MPISVLYTMQRTQDSRVSISRHKLHRQNLIPRYSPCYLSNCRQENRSTRPKTQKNATQDRCRTLNLGSVERRSPHIQGRVRDGRRHANLIEISHQSESPSHASAPPHLPPPPPQTFMNKDLSTSPNPLPYITSPHIFTYLTILQTFEPYQQVHSETPSKQ